MTDLWNALAIAPGYVIAGFSVCLAIVLVLLVLTGLEVTRPHKPEVKGQLAKLNHKKKVQP